MSDKTTTITDLKAIVAQFVAARDWQSYHNAKNLAMSIAIEAAELQEHFQWVSIEEGQQYLQTPENRAEVADELADVLIYCLSFAIQAEIDVSEAIRAKMSRNEFRFPAK